MTRRQLLAVLALALLVSLAGCSSVLGGQTPTDQPPVETATDGVNPTASEPSQTQSETADNNSGSVSESARFPESFSPSSSLPYSSDLPVDGYLRIDETQGSGLPKTSSRTFERTDSATEPGPTALRAAITIHESTDTASAWVTDRTDALRSNGSKITRHSISGESVTMATGMTGDSMETVVLSRIGNAVVIIHAESPKSAFEEFCQETLRVVLTKLQAYDG